MLEIYGTYLHSIFMFKFGGGSKLFFHDIPKHLQTEFVLFCDHNPYKILVTEFICR